MRHDAILLLGPTGSGKTPLGAALEEHGVCGRQCLHFDFGENLRACAEGRGTLTDEEMAFLRGVLDDDVSEGHLAVRGECHPVVAGDAENGRRMHGVHGKSSNRSAYTTSYGWKAVLFFGSLLPFLWPPTLCERDQALNFRFPPMGLSVSRSLRARRSSACEAFGLPAFLRPRTRRVPRRPFFLCPIPFFLLWGTAGAAGSFTQSIGA